MVSPIEFLLALTTGVPVWSHLSRFRARSPSDIAALPGRDASASVSRMSAEPAAARSAEPPDERRLLDVAALPDHFVRLYRAAYGLCGRREDAEDLVQETYARVLRRPRLLRRDEDIVYLLRVLRNTWISGHRAASARPMTSDLAEVEFVADPREDPTVDELELALEIKEIYAVIRELPEALRETVVAVDVVGLSYREAARALGTREGTIMSRLYRARERISGELDASVSEPARSISRGTDAHSRSPVRRRAE
jgi:RNA polymerase sigma-70 factor (ECF subfamily)